MITVKRYSDSLKSTWDRFIDDSKNGTFLFRRDFMGYHRDRFDDHSLLFFLDSNLVGVLPANQKDGCLHSHGGLTYGGIISGKQMTTPVMLALFGEMTAYLKSQGFRKLFYKAVPVIYHKGPAGEDLYALFVNGARLWRRDVSTTIDLAGPAEFQERRVRQLKKARTAGLIFKELQDFSDFWVILEENLQVRYGIKPVHTLTEIQKLKMEFPQNLRLFGVFKGHEMQAGVLIFESDRVAHAQYIAGSSSGKELGALDLTFYELIQLYRETKRYFDFGVSTEKDGTLLNEGLISQKEGFGGRAIVHDFYEIDFAKDRE
jgi:hypothetical protein